MSVLARVAARWQCRLAFDLARAVAFGLRFPGQCPHHQRRLRERGASARVTDVTERDAVPVAMAARRAVRDAAATICLSTLGTGKQVFILQGH